MKNATFRKETKVSNNNTQNFSGFAIGGQKDVFFFAKVTGTTLTGTMKIQVSPNNEDWVDVSSSSQNMGASGGSLYWNLSGLGAPYARAVAITTTANAATVDVWGFAKE